MPVTRREISGRLVDPVDGVVCGAISVAADGSIGAVEQRAIAPDELVFPGFIDLYVYETSQLAEHGVTGYLATCGTSRRGVVESFLAYLPDDGQCLGAHIEGPYLAPRAAGAQRPLHIRPVDPGELAGDGARSDAHARPGAAGCNRGHRDDCRCRCGARARAHTRGT